ncbi:c6 zinc finger domain-containing protein [Colletotrichum incanum]|uniref:C6 zinc finger domain-containing protein n=1 Tax=Colletotrichum incanum TaxID=1573173 RepID=A0A166Q238_COLIC|nr:c6 zinc finger domain-containing protein [Colletotrichum incanum]
MVDDGTSRKRLAVPPVKSACTSCRASRVRCSGESPCERLTWESVFEREESALSHPYLNNQNSSFDLASSQHPVVGPNTMDTSVTTSGQETLSGFLLPLFNDDLDAFQFDQIFQGDSEADLDNFFADIFSTPSFPRTVLHEPIAITVPVKEEIFPKYESTAEILSVYYQRIHPVFPILPPPWRDADTSSWTAVQIQEDFMHETSSPLMLALRSILILTSNSEPSQNSNENERQSRIRISQALYQRALEVLDTTSPIQNSIMGSFSVSNFHPNVPKESEAPLTCCVLSLYQYLHYGNLQEMNAMSLRALNLSKSLFVVHEADLSGQFAEAIRRTWWMSVWVQYIRAEEALVAATLLLVALLKGFDSDSDASSLNQSLGDLDGVISHQLSSLESQKECESCDPTEARLVNCLRCITRVRLMSARIKLHRYRAFINHPRILRRFATVPPLPLSDHDSAVVAWRKTGFHGKADRVFPFSSEQSHKICLESATSIAIQFDRLRSLGIRVTPAACSSNLAGFTLMMILHFQISAPGEVGSVGVQQEVHRQCRRGVGTAVDVLEQLSGDFGFVKALHGMEDSLPFHSRLPRF